MPPASPLKARPSHLEPVPETRPRLVAVPRLDPPPEPAVDPGRPPARGEDAVSPIPDPSQRFLGALALQGFEVLDGTRTVAQLAGAVTLELAAHLSQVRAARHERRQLYRDTRRVVPRLGRIHLCRVTDRASEASVVLHLEQRTHAVAIRLEWSRERWRASSLTVL